MNDNISMTVCYLLDFSIMKIEYVTTLSKYENNIIEYMYYCSDISQ